MGGTRVCVVLWREAWRLPDKGVSEWALGMTREEGLVGFCRLCFRQIKIYELALPILWPYARSDENEGLKLKSKIQGMRCK